MALRFYNTLTQQVGRVRSRATTTPSACTPAAPRSTTSPTSATSAPSPFEDILRRWLRGPRLRARPRHEHHRRGRQDHPQRRWRRPDRIAGVHRPATRKAFLDDRATLRLERPERLVHATEHIPDMVQAIEKLAEKGHTYASDGSVYFRIATFPRVRQALAHRLQRHAWPAPASTSTSTTRTTRATSSCGRRPRKASRSGTRRSAPGVPAGTSSAP